MGLRHLITPALDGAAVPIGDGTPRRRSLIIPAGEYATPLWLRDGAGRVERVASLPWRGVRQVGSLEVLSSDPAGGGGGGGEPQFTGAAGQTLIYEDDMESYSDWTAMGEVDDGSAKLIPAPSPNYGNPGGWDCSGPSEYAFVTGRSGTGQALRIFRDGLSEGSGGCPVSLRTDGDYVVPGGLITHYATYWARMQLASGPLTQSLNIKWFWFGHPFNRMEYHTHNEYDAGSPAGKTYWNVYDVSPSTNSQGQQPIGPTFDDLATTTGDWHRFTYGYRPHSGDGSLKDGFSRMWVDGVKICDVSQAMVDVVPPGGWKRWCSQEDVDSLRTEDGGNHTVNLLQWLSVQTTSSPAWTFDIDDLTWWAEAA